MDEKELEVTAWRASWEPYIEILPQDNGTYDARVNYGYLGNIDFEIANRISPELARHAMVEALERWGQEEVLNGEALISFHQDFTAHPPTDSDIEDNNLSCSDID